MDELAAGTEVGGYRIVSLIGRGGMGTVYLAEHAALERRVALKLLAPQYTNDASFRARFERESRIAAGLDHPNVVPIYEAGESNGVLFIAMRYVAGPDLRAVLDREGRFSVARTLGIAAQLASALDHAHAQGLIHRDVKPGNVLLAAGYGADGGEHVYLTDFGLTKHSASKSGLTQLGQMVGTIDYIAPEQITGSTVDGRADVYALGCVLFEMLAGRPPYARDSDLATMAAHLHEPPPALSAQRPELGAPADELISRALAKRPDDRFASASALVGQARMVLAGSTPAPAAGDGQTVSASPPVDPAATVLVSSSTAPGESPTSTGPTPPMPPAEPQPTPPPADERQPTPPPAPGPTVVTSPPPPPPPAAWPGPSYSGPPPAGPAGYHTAGPPPPPRPGPDRRPLLVVGLAGLALLILAALGVYAFTNGPRATPSVTAVAEISPSARPTASVSATRTAGSVAPPTADPATPTPAIVTPSPRVTPSLRPATPTPTLSPYEHLMSMLELPLDAQCEEVTIAILDPPHLVAAKCWEGDNVEDAAIVREFALFGNLNDLKAAYGGLQNDDLDIGDCPDTVPSEATWRYEGDPTSLSRGRYSCWRASSGNAQLSFTLEELSLFGVLIGDPGTIKSLYNEWYVNSEDWINSNLIQ